MGTACEVLKTKWENNDVNEIRLQIFVPKKRVPEFVQEFHAVTSVACAHKTVVTIRDTTYWLRSRINVKNLSKKGLESLEQNIPIGTKLRIEIWKKYLVKKNISVWYSKKK